MEEATEGRRVGGRDTHKVICGKNINEKRSMDKCMQNTVEKGSRDKRNETEGGREGGTHIR